MTLNTSRVVFSINAHTEDSGSAEAGQAQHSGAGSYGNAKGCVAGGGTGEGPMLIILLNLLLLK